MKSKVLKRIAAGLATMSVLAVSGYSAAYTAGTYTCSAQGHNGDVKVQVVVDGKAIKSVKVLENKETRGVADAALKMVPESIVSQQSLAVDGVSGATYASKAILAAAEECLKKAGGDMAALKQPHKKQMAAKPLSTQTADVIIIGSGGAGMSGAYFAAKNGATVIVVEKMDMIGGNTIRSGGGFNAADEPRESKQPMSGPQMDTIQKMLADEPKNELHRQIIAKVKQQVADYQAGKNTYLFDSPEFHALQTFSGGDYVGNLTLIYTLTQAAHDNIGRLEKIGLVWKGDTTTYIGALWPRSHQARDYTGGLAYVDTFAKAIDKDKLPVKYITQVKAESFVVENGKVTGIKATGKDGTPYIFKANKGVLLATGGFSANIKMRMKYDKLWGNLDEKVMTTNQPGATGDGIVMAEAIGANLVGMEYIQLLPNSEAKTGVSSGYVGTGTQLMVNKNGKRFVNELERRDNLVKAILKQPGGVFWTVTDEKNAELSSKRENKYGENIDDLVALKKVYKGNTVEELAKQIGVDPATFAQTVKEWNEMCKTQKDPEFGRNAFADNVTLYEGPYYASERTPAVHHTMGGVQINDRAQAINKDGKVIPGLWAAGEVTGGIHGTNRLGANAIPDVISFGRIAAEDITKK